jgi:hypothetical protein
MLRVRRLRQPGDLRQGLAELLRVGCHWGQITKLLPRIIWMRQVVIVS